MTPPSLGDFHSKGEWHYFNVNWKGANYGMVGKAPKVSHYLDIVGIHISASLSSMIL